jgi:hypothetical protein
MSLSALAGAVGRGLAAGVAGTAAMTVSSTIEQKARGRGASSPPADATAKVLGIETFASDAAKDRFSLLAHWGYGTLWGVPRALFAIAGLSPVAATAAHGAAVYANEQVMLPALEVAPPGFTWPVEEIAIDAWHHVVYAIATGVAYELLADD